jgi:hypothetical protein
LHDKVIDLMKAIRGLLREINIEAKAKGWVRADQIKHKNKNISGKENNTCQGLMRIRRLWKNKKVTMDIVSKGKGD